VAGTKGDRALTREASRPTTAFGPIGWWSVEQRGLILIADITGYTVYLSQSELEHAQDTLRDLLEVLVEHTRPPLAISRLEGDAVFSYALADDVTGGQTFVEMIEATYVAFRRTVDLMVLNNTCRCNACANVSSLDLKFFVHFGEFALQTVGSHEQLVGSDVNLAHRLLKNTVASTTGIRAYVLCTDSADQALGIGGAAAGMLAHQEWVQDFGEVSVWIKDMHPVYSAAQEGEFAAYDDDEILLAVEARIDLSPATVWDYLNHSELRNVLFASDRFTVVDRDGGRVTRGSTYQCYHGDKPVAQLVLDWRPFERLLIQQTIPLPGAPAYVLMDIRLAADGGGTVIRQTVARATGPFLKRAVVRVMMRMMRSGSQRDLDNFGRAIEDDRRTAKTTPVSRERSADLGHRD
jgi:hypothetical protein